MTEQEKLVRAKYYASRLANGINPITDQAVPEDSLINHVKMARFFYYISEVLTELIQGDTKKTSCEGRRAPFIISRRQLESVQLTNETISISELSKRISRETGVGSKLFSYRWPTEWLIEAGFLTFDTVTEKKVPTVAGNQIGIFQETRVGKNGPYLVTLYKLEAQRFILDNMEAILAKQGLSISDKIA